MYSLEVKNFLNYTARRVNPVIKALLTSYVDKRNKKIINYQISTGGKRIRPALAIASSKMLGAKLEDILYPAASLEILHNFSLIIDDIIDRSTLRRKKPTCWFQFGQSIAQCVSIDYAAAIFEGASQSKKSIEISKLLAKAMKAIVDGQILDLLFEQSREKDDPYIRDNRYQKITNKDYFKMVSKKTAALIQTSCEVGGLAAGAKKKDLELLGKYGFNLGIAFQIQDDILDIFGQEKLFGKETGKDIVEGKLGNIVILLAFREFSSSNKKRFLKIIRKKKVTKIEVREAMKLIKKTKSLSEASRLGETFIDAAKKNLGLLPKNKWNNILKAIADFVVTREK